jgi:hypothetical protein
MWKHRRHDREKRALRPPVSATPLFVHALRLHRQFPDAVLPRDGEPYPDDESHRRRRRPGIGTDRRREGADVATILDRHFARPEASPAELADAFHDVDGLALLATDRAPEDIPLIQTIGLLSNRFGPLAVEALRRRQGGEALLWLFAWFAGGVAARLGLRAFVD